MIWRIGVIKGRELGSEKVCLTRSDIVGEASQDDLIENLW